MTALKHKEETDKKHRYPTVRTTETCEEQLRRMCKEIAEEITNGFEDKPNKSYTYLHKWMEGVYDIEWITHQDHSYKAARLLVAGGGPNIWVNLLGNTVDGYWGCDKVSWGFVDNLGLYEHLEELHVCK